MAAALAALLGVVLVLLALLVEAGNADPVVTYVHHPAPPDGVTTMDREASKRVVVDPEAPAPDEPVEVWQRHAVELYAEAYHQCGLRPPEFHCAGGMCAGHDTTATTLPQALGNAVYAPSVWAQRFVSRTLDLTHLDPCLDSHLRTNADWSLQDGVLPRILLLEDTQRTCLVLLDEGLAPQAAGDMAVHGELEARARALCP